MELMEKYYNGLETSSDRKQRVVLNRQISDWRDILSGVPQGSVLHPLLFLIYMNDIDESVGCKILKFADDTKIYNTRCSAIAEKLRCRVRNSFRQK